MRLQKIIFRTAFFSVIVFFSLGLLALLGNRETESSSMWQYIIVHHSATAKGNAGIFDAYHRKRGMQNGLAYHFVINNGSYGTSDGGVEVGSRWEKQLHGGHCRQDWVNQHGIGICLVGDFSKSRPSTKQIRSLVSLIEELQNKYNIPRKHIAGHSYVKGEQSECPGKYFPWRDFYAQLKGIGGGSTNSDLKKNSRKRIRNTG